jgi:RimJ/RimL family protein N-acetyltransferase
VNFSTTSRLILRSFKEGDLPGFSQYRSDPEIARYQSWNTPYSLEQAKYLFTEIGKTEPGTPGEWYQIAIERKDLPGIIGDCGFEIKRYDRLQAEIGFSFAQQFQKQGYATEAVKGLIDYLFSTFNLHRIIAICDVENQASVRLLERLGMRREGHYIENIWFKGQWGSEYLYAILAREWMIK